MIAEVSKAPPSILNQVVNFTFGNTSYLQETFQDCTSKDEVAINLKRRGTRWRVLVTDRPLALFLLHTADNIAIIEHFCPVAAEALEAVCSGLKNDLGKMKVEAFTINVPEELTATLAKNGFERRNTLLRFSGRVVETKLMPILPLTNPGERDIPALAHLIHESYSKSERFEFSNVSSAERFVRDIMLGSYGAFLSDSSFVSGAAGKIVSACLVTSDSDHVANIAQLFTHPLYRARGLATTEVATCMNRLIKGSVSTLAVWVGESNEVARRLFSKLGFREDRKLIQMATNIP